MGTTQRILWVDAVKGIGIISIIFTHVTGNHSPFIYAVPIFFFISGYMQSGKYSSPQLIKKLAKRLLIPYIAFFVVISLLNIPNCDILSYCKDQFIGMLKGGNRLYGDYGTFWFINCFFLSCVTYNYIYRKNRIIPAFLAMGLLALFVQAYPKSLPWSIQTVPLAVCYMICGHLTKKNNETLDNTLSRLNNTAVLVFSAFILIALWCIPQIYLDIKYDNYGIPIISFILSVVACYALCVFSGRIHSGFLVNYTIRPLAYIGKGSLFIMFIHQYINNHFTCITNPAIHYICVCIFSVMLYYIAMTNRVTKLLFCGE